MGGRYAVLQYVIVFIAEQPVGDRIKVSGRGYVLTIPSDSLKVALSKVPPTDAERYLCAPRFIECFC